jgi:integral membrane protein
MNTWIKSPLGRFLKIGFAEGLSYLVLLLIAMPLKYWAGMPTPVRVVGMAHGVLFVAYVIALVHAGLVYKWSLKIIFVAFLLSLFPFGTFFLEKTVGKEKN